MIRLRWMSNFTDVDALAAEPGVSVRFTRAAADVERADLVILPGTKATVEDLERLRADGLDDALQARAARGDPILGVCGGYQMLGTEIEDDVESRRGRIAGLGLLPVRTTFAREKLLRRVRGTLAGAPATGYEIRHGRLHRDGGEPLRRARRGLRRRRDARHLLARAARGRRRAPGAARAGRRPPRARLAARHARLGRRPRGAPRPARRLVRRARRRRRAARADRARRARRPARVGPEEPHAPSDHRRTGRFSCCAC